MNRRRVLWSDLPPELLSKIAECLENRLDLQHFREVCKTWKGSISLSFVTSKSILSPIFPQSLATSTRSWLDSSSPCSPVLVASSLLLVRSTLNPKLPPWLLIVEELHPGKLFVSQFLSPIAIQKLPERFPRFLEFSYIQVSEIAAFHRLRFVDDPSDMFRKKEFPVFNDNRVVLFVDPNCSESCPIIGDCTAMVLHHKGEICAIRLKDEQQSHVIFDRSSMARYLEVKKFDDIVNFKGKIYAVDRRGRAYKLNYNTSSLLLLIERPSLDVPIEKKKRLAVSSNHQELFLIARSCKHGTRDGAVFKVYKLNEGEMKWDEVEGVGDDKILIVTFDGSFFASTKDFQGWKGNCIVFYNACFTSHSAPPLRDYDDSLLVYNFKDSDCHHLASYQSKMFWPPLTWLSLNAYISKRETKEDEETQTDANSQDGVSPISFEPQPMVVEQFVEAPYTSAARGSFSGVETPSSSLLGHELAKQIIEMPSTFATQDRLTKVEIPSSVMSEFELVEPIVESASASTTSRVTRMPTMSMQLRKGS